MIRRASPAKDFPGFDRMLKLSREESVRLDVANPWTVMQLSKNSPSPGIDRAMCSRTIRSPLCKSASHVGLVVAGNVFLLGDPVTN